MKREKESHCEDCGSLTKSLFQKGFKWVCSKCEKPSTTHGVTLKAKPPIGLGRGHVVYKKKVL